MITKKKPSKIRRQRTTCQKEIILDYLKSVKTHPSADKVYYQVKKNCLE